MKGNNEFIYFLFVGLVILAVLLAVFGMTIQKSEKKPQPPGIIEAVKTFSIPYLAASDMLQTQTAGIESRWVQNGLLFGSEKITYDLIKSGLQDVTLNFKVTSANGLGKLVIKINGDVIKSKVFEPGVYSIKIDSSLLSDENHFEIEAESSWWRIWAPNLYKITDVSVVYTSFSSDFSQFKFYLGEEYLNMEFAKVDLVLKDNVGTLMVDLNGRQIWKSPVSNLQSIKLDKTSLRLGDNVITFRADKDSLFAGKGAIVVIFLTQYPENLNQTGAVTAVQTFTGYSSQFYYS